MEAPLDRLLDRRLEGRAARRGDGIRARLEQDPNALRDYLMEVVLQTTLVTSLVGLLAGLLFIAGQFGFLANNIAGTILYGLGQVVAVVGAAYIVRVAGEALVIARDVGRWTSSGGPKP